MRAATSSMFWRKRGSGNGMTRKVSSASHVAFSSDASDLVANGDIKLESGVDVVRLTEDAVVLSNGKTLPADLIVYDQALKWQKLSFDALRVFAKDDLLELRTM